MTQLPGNNETARDLGSAADWIASRPDGVSVHEIKQRFGLTALQACEAIRLARTVSSEGAIHD